jgi:hypothetical protein
MASKLNMMTFLHQVRGLNAVNRRCLQPRRPERMLVPARSSAATERHQLAVSVDAENLPDGPRPVRITYLRTTFPRRALSAQPPPE